MTTTFEDRIRIVIKDRCGDSQDEFERRTGIKKGNLQKWKDGKLPSGRMLDKIRLGLGANTHWLLTGAGEPYIVDAPGGLSADKSGLWGVTRQEDGAGVMHTVTEFSSPSDASVEPEISRAVQMLSTIFVAGDDVLTRAIMSNLIAFSRAAERDKAQAERIRNLEAECADLKGRLEAVEKRLGTLTPQPGVGAGASRK